MLKMLDLFCGAGGSAIGYAEAGFEVIGVDKKPQPHYPFDMVIADAVWFAERFSSSFDAITASPPCQAYSTGTSRNTKQRSQRLIAATREAIKYKPYIIENVYGAHSELIRPIILCGSMFGLDIVRHRLFESNVKLTQPVHPPCLGLRNRRAAEAGVPVTDYSVAGFGSAGVAPTWAGLLGVPANWSQRELREAVPPAYTRLLGIELRGKIAA